MNAVLRRLQQWKQVPIDVIVISFYHLSVFYRWEIEWSMHQCGQWIVKGQFRQLKREPSLMPHMDVAPDPREMVRKGECCILPDKSKCAAVTCVPKPPSPTLHWLNM